MQRPSLWFTATMMVVVVVVEVVKVRTSLAYAHHIPVRDVPAVSAMVGLHRLAGVNRFKHR